MSSKFFNVKNPKQIVTIVEDKDKFYELSDGNMIKKDTFMQKYQPVLDDVNESISTPTPMSDNELDPSSFFKKTSLSDDVINTIKQTDSSKVPDVNDAVRSEVKRSGENRVSESAQQNYNESLVKQVEGPDIPNNTNTDVSQYKVYDNDEDAYDDFVNKNKPASQPQQQIDVKEQKMQIERLFDDEKMTFGEEEAITRRSKRLLKLKPDVTEQPKELDNLNPTNVQQPSQPTQLSPIELMFSTFKRKHPITINVSFDDLIGEPEFVKLMVENMDGDIVGYYKKKVMENIMKDLSVIEKAVELKIKEEIFGKDGLVDEEKYIEKSKENLKNLKESGKIKNLFEDKLILGGQTASGKQKYKYVDKNGNIKEVLPGTAKNKGYEPYKK